MNIVARILFCMSLFGLAVSLVVPTFDRAMSWNEATPAIAGGLFSCTLFGLLSIAFAPKKVRDDAHAKSVWRRKSGILFGLLGVVVCFGLGGFALVSCQHALDDYHTPAPQYHYDGRGGLYRQDSYSAEESYHSADGQGRDMGIVAVVTGIIPLIGMLFFVVRKPTPAQGQPTWPIHQAQDAQGQVLHGQQGYGPQQQAYGPQQQVYGPQQQGYGPQQQQVYGPPPQGYGPTGS